MIVTYESAKDRAPRLGDVKPGEFFTRIIDPKGYLYMMTVSSWVIRLFPVSSPNNGAVVTVGDLGGPDVHVEVVEELVLRF